MGTFDSIYQQKLRQLEEENKQLKKILNEGRIKDAIAKGLYKGYYKVLDKSFPLLGRELARTPFDLLTLPMKGSPLGDRFEARMDRERRREEKERSEVPLTPEQRELKAKEHAERLDLIHRNRVAERNSDRHHASGYEDGLRGIYRHWDDSREHPEYLQGRAVGTFKRVFGKDWVPYHPSESSDGHVTPQIGLAQAGLDERGSPLGTDHRAKWFEEGQWRDVDEGPRFGHHTEY